MKKYLFSPITNNCPKIILLLIAFFLLNNWQANCQYITENLTPTSVIKEGLALAQALDGRIFIAERAGILKVYQNNTVSTVFTVNTITDNEQGLLGLTLHPDFATNGYLYVFYTFMEGNTTRHRIERVQINAANQEVSRQEILKLEPINGGFHNGGDLKFFNGYLYITVGDSQQNTNSQDLDTYKGKILRITENGLPAPGNPFYGSGSLQRQSIWVYGFRNPWRLVPNAKANKLYVLDVGTSWEEVNEISSPTIRNYAWGHPQGGDGIQTETDLFANPIFTYATGSIGNALTNGVLYNPTTPRYPNLQDLFIIKDYVRKEIRSFDPTIANPISTVFFDAPQQFALGMMLGNDGYIYYCSYGNNGALIKLDYIETAVPTIVDQPLSQTVMETNPATFTVSASGVALNYQWFFNGVAIVGANDPMYTIPAVAMGNAGDYSVTVTNSAGTATSAIATLTVTTFTNPPQISLIAPLATLTWNAEDVIHFEATADDVEDGILPASAFTWAIELFHEDVPGAGHSHPGASPDGIKSGEFIASNQGEKTPNVWYRFTVTVTDSDGLTAATFVDVHPNLVDVTVTSSPALLTLELNQKTVNAPTTIQAVANATLQTLNAPTPQYIDNIRYDFDHWGHGGAINQNFQAPMTGEVTYTAFYTATAAPNVPYQGIIAQIPGIIEAENYDVGPDAYFDTNNGGDEVYRPDDEVGTEACTEGGYNIAYVAKDEWLKYTANVNESGLYTIEFRVSTPYEDKTLYLNLDGETLTGSVQIPNTGGFQTWQTVTISDIALSEGLHVITLFFEEADINLNKFEFILSATTTTPPTADYEIDRTTGCKEALVIFTSVSLGTIDNYTWNFGAAAEPAMATGPGPHAVIYSEVGTKEISLSVTNSAGTSIKNTQFIVDDCTEDDPSEIVVYPNPSSGIFYLPETLAWRIYNPTGKIISQGTSDTINITEHATGMYFIRIDQSHEIIKIMKR